jgi:ATP-dependent helicase/nuclease subunit A
LRAHPVETGLDPRFSVLDEVEAGLLINASIDKALEAIFGSQFVRLSAHDEVSGLRAQFATLLEELGPGELRSTLSEMLRGGNRLHAALESMPSEAEALAQYWRERTLHLQAEASSELLADPAWQTAVAQLGELAAVASPNDKLGAQVLALAPTLAGEGTPNFATIAAIDLRGGSKKYWPDEGSLQAARTSLRMLRESYAARADLINPASDAVLEERAARVATTLFALYRLAENHLRQQKAAGDQLDFDDLERLARNLLEQHPAVRRRWQQSLRAILVDEFQDTNDDQRAIVYGLAGVFAGTGTRPELFIVGDGKQSIYRFRGAEVGVFAAVERDVLALGGTRVELATSFRSHSGLVGWINQTSAAIFARNRPLRSYEFPFAALQAYRPAAPHPIYAELHLVAANGNAAAQRAAEAEAVVARIAAMVSGAERLVWEAGKGWRAVGYGDIALLFQASSGFESFEAALRAAGVPFLTTAGRGYYGRKEIQDLIHLLRVLDDPADDLALVGVLRSPLFALDDGSIMALRLAGGRSLWDALMGGRNTEDAESHESHESHEGEGGEHHAHHASHEDEGSEHHERYAVKAARRAVSTATGSDHLQFARDTLRELYALRSRVTVVELLRAALAATGYLATISGLSDGERRRVNVEKLVQAARLSGGRGLYTFREYLDRLLSSEVREGEAPLEAEHSVRLMTIHRSKGLEFPIVGLPDLGRGAPALRTTWLAEANEGLAIQLRDRNGEAQRPLALQRALANERLVERAERERLLYVALTRAQDYLLLSGTVAKSDGDDWLSRLLAALGAPWSAGGPPASEDGGLRVVRSVTSDE